MIEKTKKKITVEDLGGIQRENTQKFSFVKNINQILQSKMNNSRVKPKVQNFI